MNEDLLTLQKWFYNNLLTFNLSKTKYMIITQRNLTVNHFGTVGVDGQEIERVYSQKYLGLHIDSCLSWNDHVEAIKKKIQPFLAVLRRCHYLLECRARLSLYFSHIHTHFIHLLSIWGVASESRLDQLQVLQNKAIRHVF